MDKVDAIVYNRVPPPTGLAQQLLHHDQPWLAAAAVATAAASAAAAGGTAGQGTAAGAAAAAETFAYGLRLSASCPKLGVALCMRPPAAAPPEAQLDLGPGQQRPAYVQVTLHSISADMDPAGARQELACLAARATHPTIALHALPALQGCTPARCLATLPTLLTLPFATPCPVQAPWRWRWTGWCAAPARRRCCPCPAAARCCPPHPPSAAACARRPTSSSTLCTALWRRVRVAWVGGDSGVVTRAGSACLYCVPSSFDMLAMNFLNSSSADASIQTSPTCSRPPLVQRPNLRRRWRPAPSWLCASRPAWAPAA